MSRAFTACILRYDDKLGRCKNLLGIVTFSDGKSLKVWGSTPVLHKQCQVLAQTPTSPVTYTFKHSEKWGDSLSMIASTKADHERYDDARMADEQHGGPYAKAGSYLGNQISKRVQRDSEQERVR